MRSVFSSPRRCRVIGLLLFGVLLSSCDRHHTLPQCGAVLAGDPGRAWALATDGTARQTGSGLTWFRCNAGERFSSGACVGEPLQVSHAEAMQYAQDFSSASGRAWRLPTIEEMRDLRVSSCHNPAVDTRVFPSVRSDHYWAAQSGPRGFGFACSVYTFNVMAQCRDDPQQPRLFWLVMDR
jgi:hypothetical protein